MIRPLISIADLANGIYQSKLVRPSGSQLGANFPVGLTSSPAVFAAWLRGEADEKEASGNSSGSGYGADVS